MSDSDEFIQEYLAFAKLAQRHGNQKKADSYLQKARDLTRAKLETHFNLGNIYAHYNLYEQAIEHYSIFLEEYPNTVSVLYNTAFCLKKMGNVDEALEFYDRALKLKPNYRNAIFGKTNALLTKGRYLEAWPGYEYRWTPPRKNSKEFKEYLETHGTLQGKTVLLFHEYSLGDTFQFIRFAQLLKALGATVIFQAQKPLVDILSLCPYLDQVIPADLIPLPEHDLETNMLSLPWTFQISPENLPNKPYVYTNTTIENDWKQKLSNDHNLKIGICWHGNLIDGPERSMPLKLLEPVIGLKGVSVYSLQRISGTEQIKELSSNLSLHTFDEDFDTANGRFIDTAAVIKNLDLVLTIDTSIAHLAGALGVPTWLMLCHVADWRWMEHRQDSPWYPCTRIFRQEKQNQWEPVIACVVEELKKLISKK